MRAVLLLSSVILSGFLSGCGGSGPSGFDWIYEEEVNKMNNEKSLSVWKNVDSENYRYEIKHACNSKGFFSTVTVFDLKGSPIDIPFGGRSKSLQIRYGSNLRQAILVASEYSNMGFIDININFNNFLSELDIDALRYSEDRDFNGFHVARQLNIRRSSQVILGVPLYISGILPDEVVEVNKGEEVILSNFVTACKEMMPKPSEEVDGVIEKYEREPVKVAP